MKLWQFWFYSFFTYYSLVDIFFSLCYPEERRFTATIIQSVIFSTLLVAFSAIEKVQHLTLTINYSLKNGLA